jgi:hypothetical protein
MRLHLNLHPHIILAETRDCYIFELGPSKRIFRDSNPDLRCVTITLNTRGSIANRDADTSPERGVVGHPLLEVAYHSLEGFAIDRYVVRPDLVNLCGRERPGNSLINGIPCRPAYLLPTLAAGGLQSEVDILKCLVNLSVDLAGASSR